MSRLNLRFLEDIKKKPSWTQMDKIEQILHEFGQEIYDYAKGYFNYIVSTTSSENHTKEASLFIIVPEIGYDYKILSLKYQDSDTVLVKFYGSIRFYLVESFFLIVFNIFNFV